MTNNDSKKFKKSKKSGPSLKGLDREIDEASGKLLETTGTMQSFAQALNTSGFREYVDYLGRPWHSFWINFIMGIARGLGFVIGATVVATLVVWIMSRFLSQLPFIGDFFLFMQELLSPENIDRVRSGEFLETFSESLQDYKTGPVNPLK